MSPRFLLTAALALLTAGCGYVGGPALPLANVPVRPTPLAALQRGSIVIAQFPIPDATTEGNPIMRSSLTLDLRIGTRSPGASESQWAASARRVEPTSTNNHIAYYEIPAADFVNKEVVIGSHVVGENHKDSGWSNLVTLLVVPSPEVPTQLHAEPAPRGVRVSWHAAGGHFHVLRKGPADSSYVLVAPDVTAQEWVDLSAEAGKPYSYLVQTFMPLGQGREAQSDLPAPIEVKAQAAIPPTPTGLRAVPGPASVELSWEIDTEAGVLPTSYRIYRATGDTFDRIGEATAGPVYSDSAVEHGKTYRYAVTAVNAEGREGPRSAPITVVYQ